MISSKGIVDRIAFKRFIGEEMEKFINAVGVEFFDETSEHEIKLSFLVWLDAVICEPQTCPDTAISDENDDFHTDIDM